jgi:anaerobic selenocysteine-containing dehydrogenase
MSRIGPVLTNDPVDIGDGPPVTAMLIQNTNPMAVAPDSGLVHRGFARDDLFVCVHEQFLTETARMADIVLPATSFLEHDDVYQAGGNQYILLGPKVIEPYADTRENHFVIAELAKRLGAAHPGFDMTPWQLIDWTLKASGWPDAEALRAEKWHDCQPDFETSHYLSGFKYPDGKFHFVPDWSRIGPDFAVMPRLPDHFAIIDEASDEHPFRMVTAPARNFLNSSFTETPTSVKRERRPTVMIHPEDARDLGLVEDSRVRLGNRRGEVVLHARLFDGVQRGVVIVESIWPNAAFETGIGINALTGDDPAPPNGGAAFHDTAVWVRVA